MNYQQLHVYPYVLCLCSFIIGAIGIFFIRRNNPERAKGHWIKYFVYLFLSQLLITLLIYQIDAFKYLAFIILLGMVVDLRKTRTPNPDVTYPILYGLIIIYGFYVYEADQEKLLRGYLLVFCFDGYSQICGQLFGRTRFNSISPDKTLEGVIGGAVLTLVLMFIFKRIGIDSILYLMEILIMILAAFLGDLLASLRKRVVGIKDYGTYLPYHGGTLDRFDSLLGVYSVSFLLHHLT